MDECYTVACGTTPRKVGSATTWAMADCGTRHCMAVRSDGTLWGWGDVSDRRIGISGSLSCESGAPCRTTPGQVTSYIDWQFVVAGGAHSLGIRQNGSIWGWGANHFGQLGMGGGDDLSPTQLGGL